MSLLALRSAPPVSPASRYDTVADASAALVIRRYSTSFGLAARLLAEPVRTHVRNVYALVRVADEIVDAPRPGSTTAERRRLLDAFEGETAAALATGHSANLVVHAFARMAATCGITSELTSPFFASMRTDLDRSDHDETSFAAYVYGSAEVVGLMCLRTFVRELSDPTTAYEALSPGARRLGAAFQKLNFLRDLAADHDRLGRCYFPGVEPANLSAAQRDHLLDDIDDELRVAARAIDALPASSRRAVALAHALFAALARELRTAPVERIRHERVRVPGPVKAGVVAKTLLRGAR
ncbi:phytoene/squalene synthase family protein [Mumia sp. Pv 4-285]|uniref:phytoene/squalene synthase family protein n=1 Tax=Mumia qirimensis TaxID=3234852 RepID=UPI00351D06D8